MAQRDIKKIGKYDVLDVLGRGGMGVVYKALDPSIGRTVAIKMMSGGDNDPELIKRFYREAQSAGVLQHPNILTIHDLGDLDGDPYIVMEFLEGTTLERIITSRQPLTLFQRLEIVIQVLHGLQYAHDHGVIHRDVKPSNVAVLPDGTCKLLDFGVARLHGASETRTGEVIGTLKYISPEQLNAQPLDARVDIWATGVMLYQLLTGVVPFEGSDTASTLLKIIHDVPPPVAEYAPNCPPAMEEIVKRSLTKNREERYPTAQEFADELLHLQDTVKDQLISEELEDGRRLLAAGELNAARNAVQRALRLDADHPELKALSTAIIAALQQRRSELAVGTSKEQLPAPDIGASASEPIFDGGTIIVPSASPETLNGDRAAAQSADEHSSRPGEFTQIFGRQERLPRVRLTLTVSEDPQLVGRTVIIDTTPFTIGRSRECNWALNDRNLSRQHVRIEWDQEGFLITDLGSRNGTHLNGRRVSSQAELLPFGAVIRLGHSAVITFTSDEAVELPDLTGQLLNERYRLNKLLRSGTKTALYEAADTRLPQRVAVKILSPIFATYPGYLDHLKREAEMASRLQHSHICRILDYGQANVRVSGDVTQVHYLCMELMEGGSLAERLQKDDLPELLTVITWVNDICDALQHSHSEGLVHGGLKLSSIVFGRDGKPYVTDFAMASRAEDGPSGVFLASSEFLAPEVWDKKPATALSDQYSLASIAYLILTGGLPFEGQLDPNIRRRNFERGPIAAHEEAKRNSRSEIPVSVSQVLNRALSVNPADRYPDMREFALGLQYAVSHPKKQVSGRPRVFLSYRRDEGSAWAMLFARELDQKHEIDAFVDTQRLDSGPIRFPIRLKKAIEECSVFVCLLSENTLRSKWVQEEIRLAYENNKPMVPVFQESFVQPGPSDNLDPHVETLLTYEGVPLMDQRNVFVYEAIAYVARIVKTSA